MTAKTTAKITVQITVHITATYLLLISLLALSPPALAEPAQESPRFLVHLLDYLAQDYPGAVENGKIKNLSEYKEQLEFSKTVVSMGARLELFKNEPEIQSQLKELAQLIQKKSDPKEVAALARRIQRRVLIESGIELSPSRWPNQANGLALFTRNCVSCHGISGKGDGPAALNLEPKPANLLEPKRMSELSPFQVFNAIRLGLPGTAMPAQSLLTDEETWDLAYYVLSLRHRLKAIDSATLARARDLIESASKSGGENPWLRQTATKSDQELRAERLVPVGALRVYSPDHTGAADGAGSGAQSLRFAAASIEQAVREYRDGFHGKARQTALAAYLEGVEPVEARLRAVDAFETRILEERMGRVRELIERQGALGELQVSATDAISTLKRAEKTLAEQKPSSWFAFLMAAGILFREGFEAVLVVIAFLTIVRASGAKKAERWIHAGWVLAVLCGFVAWFFSGWLLAISGAGRELLEAVTSVFAVGVLLYFGLWLHGKTELDKWKSFIHKRTKNALEGRSLIGLAGISFVAVFREVFETVLFLRATWLESGVAAKTALISGVGTAFAAVLLLGYVLVRYSAAIPIRKLFTASSALMVLLAVILAGKGAHSFQESGVLGSLSLPVPLRVDLLGVYPTLQTLLAQAVVLAFALLLWNRGQTIPRKA